METVFRRHEFIFVACTFWIILAIFELYLGQNRFATHYSAVKDDGRTDKLITAPGKTIKDWVGMENVAFYSGYSETFSFSKSTKQVFIVQRACKQGNATVIIYVREYGTVYLDCPVSPVVSWQEFDSKKIVVDCHLMNQLNPDVENKMFVWSNCQLGIYNFTTNGPNVFQCLTPNGTYKINISLVVPPANMRIQGANEKNEVYGIAGKSTTISCRVNSGIPMETMSWKRNDELLILGGPSVLNYTFNAADSDDMAIMTCSANNTKYDTSLSKQIKFRIIEKPAVMLKASPQSTVLEGDPISLICISKGGTIEEFNWKHNGLRLQIYSNSYIIKDTRRSHAGSYSCIGRNIAGNSSDNATVIVKYAPVVENERIVFTLDEIMRNISCKASGVPSEYTYGQWQHLTFHGQLIRHFYGNDNGTLSLPYQKYEDQRYQDIGIYVCTVSNNVPDANGNVWQTGRIHVTIKGRPVLAYSNETTVQFGYFNSISNIVLNIFSSAAIIHVTWFDKDNKILQKYESCTFAMIQTNLFGTDVSISGHRCSMTITNTKPENFQNYTVKIDNEDGSNYFQVVLKAVLIKRIEAFPKSTVTDGDSLTLICHFENIPFRPKIKWKYNSNVLLVSGQLQEYNSIHFPSVNRQQTGNYSCEIDSDLGFDKKTIFIRIEATQSKMTLQSFVSFGLMIGMLVSFLVCWYIIKALKKKIMIHIQRNKTSMERSMRHESSESNNESHYDEIDSVYYGPVQIHEDTVVQITAPAVNLQNNDPNYAKSQNTDLVRESSNELNERLSQNSETISNNTQSQASEDSYLVPCKPCSDCMTNKDLHKELNTITNKVEISSISSNESETRLKSDHPYESLKPVNINEHQYLYCVTVEPNRQLAQEEGL